MYTELLCDERTALEVEKEDGRIESGMGLMPLNCTLKSCSDDTFYNVTNNENKSKRKPIQRVWK